MCEVSLKDAVLAEGDELGRVELGAGAVRLSDGVSVEALQEGSSRAKASFARFVTNLGAPPFTFLAASYVVAYGSVAKGSQKAELFSSRFLSPNDFERSQSLQHVSSYLQENDIAALVGGIGGILPLLFLAVLRFGGIIGSLDLDTLRERIIGFLFATGCGVVLLPILQAIEAPPLFFIFLYAHLLATFCLFFLTLYTMRFGWKTSVHSGGAACLCFVSLLCFSWLAWLWAPILVVLISWSRLYLHRHTVGQVVLGVFLAFGCYAAVFSVFDISLLAIFS
ncbi:phosphatase PAP2 family protein [bacterium]|nr:phosphatase PAP2 family protein [bacterium]